MSRGQETEVNTTAGDQNAQFNQNAQSSYTTAQGDVGNYQNQLAEFAAANPYGQGGPLQTAQNQATANTADAASQAAREAAQSQAVRTGQNAAGGIASGQAVTEADTRNLMAQQATNNASRIAAGAGYGKDVLSATQVPASLEAGLAAGQAGAGNTAIETQQKAAETPDLGEELMGGVLSAGTAFAGGFGQGYGGAIGKNAGSCWIAAELYGGWEDRRVILLRLWLMQVFSRRWYGPMLLSAYVRGGECAARAIRTRKWMRRFFQWWFDGLLAQAEAWLATSEGRKTVNQQNFGLGPDSPYLLNLEGADGKR